MSSEAPISPVDIDQAVKRFEDAWRRGECPTIDDYCTQARHRRGDLLQALVVIDLDFRLKAGQPQRTEDYLREFPELQAYEQVILKLLRVEARWAVGPAGAVSDGASEFVSRSQPLDVEDRSSGAALETAASGADLSVIGPTQSAMPRSVSDMDFSGETVSARNSPSEARIPPTRTLGRFRLVDAVGQGGFGTVFRSIDTGLGRVVAIKVPREGVLGSEKEQERFIREARAAALRHAHIVSVYEVGGTREQPFIVSEFVRGQTLSKALAARQFEPREAARIVRVMADALQYAHERGVIHRDVKPANIMLDDRGEPFLMDFGLARRDGEALITVDGQILGTPAYMSPEQAEGRRADFRSDVYSVGIVLYELLTGRRPFRGNVQSVLHQVAHTEPCAPTTLNRAVPRDLEKICLKCVRKIPDDRYASAGELAEDLARFLEGLPVRARPIWPLARGWRWVRRRPRTAILAAAVVVLGISVPIFRLQLDEARESARQVELANRLRLEKLFVSKGNSSLEIGDPIHALPWFGAALNQASVVSSSELIQRVRLVTAMNASRLVQMWPTGGPINSVSRQPKGRLLAVASAAKAATLLDPFDPSGRRIVLPHPEPVSFCAFSPDGKRLATFCNDAIIRVWWTSSLSSDPLLLDHDRLPKSMSFDPTSRLLASATQGGAVRIWNLATGTQRGPVLVHRANVEEVSFNEDGTLLATACADGAVHLWSCDTGKELTPPLPHQAPVNCVGFAPNGRLYSGSDDGTVRGWDVRSHAQKVNFSVGRSVLHLAFSPDGTRMAAGCRDGDVHVRSLVTQGIVPSEFHHEQRVSTLSFSRDGGTLVTGSLDHTVRVWNLTTGAAAMPPFICAKGVTWAELADDQQHLLAAGFDGFLREWSLGGDFKAEQRLAGIGVLRTVILSSNGRWLLLNGKGGSAQICDLESPPLTVRSLENSAGASRAASAPDGNRLALVEGNGHIDIWDITGQPKLIQARIGKVTSEDVGFSPDGRTLVIASDDGSVQLLPIIDGGFRSMWRHGDGLRRAAFSIDGKTVYTAGGQRLCLWDPSSGKLLSEYRSQDGNTNIEDCQQSSDGRFLIATQRATLGLICSASTCEFAGTTKLPIASVAFSEDGLRFVAMTSERTAAVWKAALTAKEVDPFIELSERSDATCCAIRSDGMLIATGSGKTARVWDAETSEPVSPPLGHSDRVIFVGFREHGNQLVTVSADAVIRLWTLDDGSSNERLTHLAKATSGVEIDENGAPATLTPDRIEAEWNAAAGDTRGESR